MKTIDGRSLIEEMELHGMYTGADKIYISIKNSMEIFKNAMKYFISIDGNELVWKDEYNEIAEWLSDNKGRGLFMSGNSGLGKSVIGMRVIPAILLKYCKKVVRVYSANDINKEPENALKSKLICIDDIGTEDILNSFGNKRMVFSEIIDNAEKKGNLVIISSNLDKDGIIEKYGFRVYDRIISTTKRINFNGKSFRN